MEAIRSESTKAGRIITNLLSLSETDEPKLQPVDILAVARNVSGLARYEARKQNVTVEIDIGENVPRFLADATQLEHVLFNLVANSCQAVAGRGRGRVTIRARPVGASVRVEVADDGPGIPVEALPHVFKPFFSTKPANEGAGLGLAIGKGMVESQGGEIAARNAPGGGAVFELTFPAIGES